MVGPLALREVQKEAVYTKTNMGATRDPANSLQQCCPSQSSSYLAGLSPTVIEQRG